MILFRALPLQTFFLTVLDCGLGTPNFTTSAQDFATNKLALEAPLLLLALRAATAPPLLFLAEPFKPSWPPLADLTGVTVTKALASWGAGEGFGVFPWTPLLPSGCRSSSFSSAIGNGVGGWEMEKRPLLKGAGEPEGILGVAFPETRDEAPGDCWAGEFLGDLFSS